MPAPRILVAVLAAACALAAPARAQTADAQKHKDLLTGDARIAASANPQCRLFTPAEIGTWLGAAVGAGENGSGGAGCQWHDKDFNVLSYVTVVAAAKYAEPSGSKGFKRLPAIGPKAWTAPEPSTPGSWSAGTFEGDLAILVHLDGPKASEAAAVAFLQETLRRRRR